MLRPSLHSTSSLFEVRRMFLNVLPRFRLIEEPLTLRSRMTWTVSPSLSSLPWASHTIMDSTYGCNRGNSVIVAT